MNAIVCAISFHLIKIILSHEYDIWNILCDFPYVKKNISLNGWFLTALDYEYNSLTYQNPASLS